MLDLTTEFGRRVARRLEEEWIIWLTTVDQHHIPRPRPVWFWWDGESFLIYSQPDTYKLQHIAGNDRVALNLDGDGRGGDIVVITGRASLAPDAPPANQVAEYVDKYREAIARINMSVEGFAEAFSVGLRVTPVKLRGH